MFYMAKGITTSHDIWPFTSPHSVYIHHLYHMGIVGLLSLISVNLFAFDLR